MGDIPDPTADDGTGGDSANPLAADVEIEDGSGIAAAVWKTLEAGKLVQTALAKRPERRWQSAREMVAGLERIEAQLAENPSLACPGTRRLRRG
jgi:hypothetical protein